MKREIIYPAIYKHFKNELEPEKYIYATMGISEPIEREQIQKWYEELKESEKLENFQSIYCKHTETKKTFLTCKINGKLYHEKSKYDCQLVLYKSLYDDAIAYARPLEMFAGKVDKEKYPEIKQEFRFELVRY
ncbi:MULTISPECIES: DUF1653 domain-containing protein [Bacteria]|uniref:DUF1653 domain-containing protein n=1 Tax=Bacteria TaxID=2 RepID=UPI0012B16DCE|nr:MULTISPECIES: DUF1653 domain-containing protein [Bacteria]MRY42827.1 DUF1653 domain-containing protein [Parabacteroides distasonis]MZK53348.1 DUF1653 domain-containing protein [Clostridium beijerinckii]MZK61453.1 DUF1653 domain-containing protein [Clostridium beijerinckii]MZK71695.1 DUF1653 domain-containing protein [Clostridium beijerinckii]MZK77088.1 DUF1653 domain-containing protein [Clostridium beijerinckii]